MQREFARALSLSFLSLFFLRERTRNDEDNKTQRLPRYISRDFFKGARGDKNSLTLAQVIYTVTCATRVLICAARSADLTMHARDSRAINTSARIFFHFVSLFISRPRSISLSFFLSLALFISVRRCSRARVRGTYSRVRSDIVLKN